MNPSENDFHLLVTNFGILGSYIRVYGQVNFQKSFEISKQLVEAFNEGKQKRVEEDVLDDVRNRRIMAVLHDNEEVYRFRVFDSKLNNNETEVAGFLVDYMIPYRATIGRLYRVTEALRQTEPLIKEYILKNVRIKSDQIIKDLLAKYQHTIVVARTIFPNEKHSKLLGDMELLELLSMPEGYVHTSLIKNDAVLFCDTETQIQQLNCMFYSQKLAPFKRDQNPMESKEQQKLEIKEINTDFYKKENWVENVTYSVKIIDTTKGPWSFIVQKSKAESVLKEFENYTKTQKLVLYAKKSRKCLVKNSNCFLRGYVTEFLDDSFVKVFCVDIYTYMTTKLNELYELPAKFTDIAAQAAEFRLFGLDDKLKTKSISLKFHEHLHDQIISLIVRAKPKNNIWEADVIQSNLNFIDLLRLFASNGQMSFYKTLDVPSLGSVDSIYVSHAENMGKFYIQYNKYLTEIEEIVDATAKLSECSYGVEEYEVKKSSACLVFFNKDRLWYRGVIMDKINVNEVQISFVDYGNIEILKLMYLKHIPNEYVRKWPSMAVECCLDGFENWTNNDQILTEQFVNLVLEKTFNMKVLRYSEQSNSLVVELIDETGKNVIDLLKRKFNKCDDKKTTQVQSENVLKSGTNQMNINNCYEENQSPTKYSKSSIDDPIERGRSVYQKKLYDKNNKSGKFDRDNNNQYQQKPYRNTSARSSSEEMKPPYQSKYNNDNRTQSGRDYYKKRTPSEDSSNNSEWSINRSQNNFKNRNSNNYRTKNAGYNDTRSIVPMSNQSDNWDDDNNLTTTSRNYRKSEINYPKHNDNDEENWDDDDNISSIPVRNEHKSNYCNRNINNYWDGDNTSKLTNNYNKDRNGYRNYNKQLTVTNDNEENWNNDNENINNADNKSFYTKHSGVFVKEERKSNNNYQRFSRNLDGNDNSNYAKSNNYSKPNEDDNWDDNNDLEQFNKPNQSSLPNETCEKFKQLFKLSPYDKQNNHFERISFNERFNEIKWPLNVKFRVRISYYKSLSDFTCRLSDNEAYELNMILKRTYQNQENLAIDLLKFSINDIFEGACIVVLYHADYHRGYISEIIDQTKVKVYLVDSGYDVVISLEFCFPIINKEILNVPVQIIKASLFDRAHLIERPVIHDSLMGRILLCKIHDFINDRYEVELFDRGAPFINFLLEKNCVYILEEERQIYDYSYLIGSYFKVYITHIESFENFYIQFDKDKADEVIQKIYEIIEKNTLNLLTNFVNKQRAIIFDSESNQYRRVQIVDFDDLSAITVILTDTGKTIQVPNSDIYEYPSKEILRYELQAAKCSFKSQEKFLTLEQFQKMKNQFYIAYIRNATDSDINLTLFELNGEKINIEIGLDNDVISVPKILPYPLLKRSEMEAYVSTIVDFDNIYIQPDILVDKLSNLLTKMYTFYENTCNVKKVEDIYADMICVCKSKADDNWYRAKIVSIIDQEIKVLYVDYGNFEVFMNAINIYELDKQFYDLHALSIHVNMKNIDERLLNYVKDQVIDKKLNVMVNPDYSIEIFIDRKSLIDLVLIESQDIKVEESLKFVEFKTSPKNYHKHSSQSLVKESLSSQQTCITPISKPDIDDDWDDNDKSIASPKLEQLKIDKNKVLVSHMDSVNDFYIQLESNYNEISEFSRNINVTLIEKTIDLIDFEIGKKCLAKFSEDEQWYRAEILDFDQDIITVRFYDYGNTEVLSVKDRYIKVFNDENLNNKILIEQKSYAERCTLNCTVIENEDCVKDRFFELIYDEVLLIENISYDHVQKKKIIELRITNGTAITQKLIEEKLVNKIKSSTLIRKNGFVSHLNSLDDFWIQFDNHVEDLEKMIETLTNISEFPIVSINDIVTETKLYAAQFSDDNQWYRVQVLKINVDNNGEHKVLFVDYGNTGLVKEIRELPNNLATKELLAKHCSLQKPAGLTTWSQKANVQFKSLAADGATEFIVKFNEINESNVVDLYVSDVESEVEINVINKLDLQTDVLMGSTVKEMQGIISSFQSELEFWFQSIDIKDNLETLAKKLSENNNRLSDVDNFHKKLFTVFYNEKNIYCRAEILEKLPFDNYKVLLVDYGITTEVSEIFELSDELMIIPKLAMKCSSNDIRICDRIDFDQVLKIRVLKQENGLCEIELIAEPVYSDEYSMPNLLDDERDLEYDDLITKQSIDKQQLNLNEFTIENRDNRSMEYVTKQIINEKQELIIDEIIPTNNELELINDKEIKSNLSNEEECLERFTDLFSEDALSFQMKNQQLEQSWIHEVKKNAFFDNDKNEEELTLLNNSVADTRLLNNSDENNSSFPVSTSPLVEKLYISFLKKNTHK